MKSCPSDCMALSIVRVRIFWTSNIFVINVFPYTHDTGAVTARNQVLNSTHFR